MLKLKNVVFVFVFCGMSIFAHAGEEKVKCFEAQKNYSVKNNEADLIRDSLRVAEEKFFEYILKNREKCEISPINCSSDEYCFEVNCNNSAKSQQLYDDFKSLKADSEILHRQISALLDQIDQFCTK
jgi:hypothetical protein